MSIVWTNLKLALWRKRFDVPFAIAFFCTMKMLNADVAAPLDPNVEVTSPWNYPWFHLIAFAFIVLLVACGVSIHERQTTAKPLSFCLPGYRQSLRGLVFLAALPCGLFLASLEVPHLWHRTYFTRGVSPEPLDICLRLGGAFLVGTATCVAALASRLVLSRLQWGLLALASFPLGIVAVVVWIGVDAHASVVKSVVGAAGIPVCIFCWIRLGDMRYVARGHRLIIEDAMEERSQIGVKRTAPPWTDGLFLTRAERYPFLGIRRHIWAGLYRAFGPIFSYWRWGLAAVLILSAVLATSFETGVEIAFASLGLLMVMVDLPVNSNLLLPGSRRTRFSATVITVMASSLFLVALAIGMSGFSEVIAVVFDADAGGLSFRLRSIWLACILVPWMAALQLRGHRLMVVENGASAIILVFLLLMIVPTFLGVPDWPAQNRLLLFVSIGFSGWAVFLLSLRHVCLRGSLIGSRMPSGE